MHGLAYDLLLQKKKGYIILIVSNLKSNTYTKYFEYLWKRLSIFTSWYVVVIVVVSKVILRENI